jgi:hypothetical protein
MVPLVDSGLLNLLLLLGRDKSNGELMKWSSTIQLSTPLMAHIMIWKCISNYSMLIVCTHNAGLVKLY